MRTPRNYGWIPSPPDHRDRLYTVPPMGKLPAAVDLRTRHDEHGRPLLGTAWQQGRLNSCQTHAAGKAWQYVLGLEGLHQFTPSRLFVYYNARRYQGWEKQDVGAYTRDAVKALAEFGAPPETAWPYKVTKYAVAPPADAYTRAEKRVALEYVSVPQDPDGLSIAASLAEGIPVIVGFTMYDGSMPTRANGYFQAMPKRGASVVGRHAVLVVGYTNVNGKTAWIILDSDGTWLDDGYWFMDGRYLTDPDLATDFWAVRKVGHAS